MNARQDVMYCRFSSEQQRIESNVDQERRCRVGLDDRKIPHEEFLVLADEAISGVSEDRPGFQKLKELIYSDRLGILVVTEQSRLTRSDNAMALIKDIVFHGGRFISIMEGIDTENKGWELLVGISGIHHSHSNKDTAERVRGAHEGRVLDGNGSAGDFPYGYRSEYIDPVAANAYRGRGPKPKKIVMIEAVVAAVVLMIFQRFAAGESIGSIVRWLNRDSTIPPIGKNGWHHQHVRRMLTNEKYIGRWVYGKTSTVYDAHGKKKQVPARRHQRITVVERLDLRIIDDDLWQKVQYRLAELTRIFGMKENGKRRGPSEHYRLLYPKRLLNGKIICVHCGSRLIDSSSNGIRRLGCPKHKAGVCPVTSRVPVAEAECAIFGIVREILSSYPEWMNMVFQEMRNALVTKGKEIPSDLEITQRLLREKQKEMNNLLDVAGRINSERLDKRIEVIEIEIASLKDRVSELLKLNVSAEDMPTDQWIREQMRDLADVLANSGPEVIKTLRSVIGDITAEEIKAPGKQRGFMRLRFRLHGWAILRQVLADQIPQGVLAHLSTGGAGDVAGQEVVIDLGKPTRMDSWAPQIAEWRSQRVPWKEIVRRTGLAMANAFKAYRRFTDSGKDAA